MSDQEKVVIDLNEKVDGKSLADVLKANVLYRLHYRIERPLRVAISSDLRQQTEKPQGDSR